MAQSGRSLRGGLSSDQSSWGCMDLLGSCRAAAGPEAADEVPVDSDDFQLNEQSQRSFSLLQLEPVAQLLT